MIAFIILGYLCFGFGVIDFVASLFGYDFTGVQWSPIAAGLVGSALLKFGGRDESPDSDESPETS